MAIASDLARLAKSLNGEVRGGKVHAPGPGHSSADRSLTVWLDSDGDVKVHSFAADDPIRCKDYVREKAGLPAFALKKSSSSRFSTIDIQKSLSAAIAAQAEPR